MGSFDRLLIISAGLLLISVVASKAASRFGVPSLLVFLGLGIFCASKTTFQIQFHDLAFAQGLAIVSLCFILFSGGLSTSLKEIKPILKSGLALSTLGVLIASGLVGIFAIYFLHFSAIGGLLLGATVASTDVAAVFTVLRSKKISLKTGLKSLLEFESAVNDPMTVFLSVGLLQIYTHSQSESLLQLLPHFIVQMSLGSMMGGLGGKVISISINRLKLEFEGLYPVLSFASVLLIYALTQRLGGSGFLAVYVAGIFLGSRNFLHKKSLTLFHDGLAWLTQIAMFLAMGLLVEFSSLSQVAVSGIFLSIFLIAIARPISVFICLKFFGYGFREVLMVSWAGLRGAVPIILATYPLSAGIPEARLIFNLAFFVVLTSVLFQGATIARVARWLKVDAPLRPRYRYPIEFNPTENLKNELIEVPVEKNSPFVGQSLVTLNLPPNALIVLIHRGDDVIVPRGGTHIEAGDMLLLLADQKSLAEVQQRASFLKDEP